tara:strand:+ start:95 stop:1888 length:1794 start_codon:yes stop_codon:yes gene_type:complete
MINPEKKTIDNILSSSKLNYTVPEYQRSFDWGKEELQEFLDDLNDASENNDRDLFLGNFIFDVSKESVIEIVDGQQRLTTISLTFIALREIAREKNEQEIVNECQNYIGVYSAIRKTNNLKFNLSKNIRDIYKIMASKSWDGKFPEKKEDGTSLKKQINKIRPLFNAIKDRFKDHNTDKLTKLLTTLLDTYVVTIEVDSDESKFAIFERTNARGLDLNIGDLVKNHIFSYQDKSINEKWDEIVTNAKGNLPKMLKYAWISKQGHIMQSKLYREIKHYVGKPENSINTYVDELLSFSKFYSMFNAASEASTKEWLSDNKINFHQLQYNVQEITRVIQALKLFRVTQIIPLLYSIFNHYKRTGQKRKDKLISLFQTFEKYHFTNNIICGRVANEVEKFYANSAKAISEDNENELVENVLVTDREKEEKFINHLKSKKAKRDEFTSQFVSIVYYSQRNIPIINYLFDRINNKRNSKKKITGGNYVTIYDPSITYQKRNFNIEHLLSQKYLDEKNENFNSDVIHSIGNLLIIPFHTNSGLPDKMTEKIEQISSDKKYIGSLRYINDFLDKYEDDFYNWGKESIEKRSINLAQEAYDTIWYF